MKAVTSGKGFPPPLFYARIIDRINSQNKVEALKEVSSWKDDFPTPDLVLLNEYGQVIYPEGRQKILNWDDIKKPELPYDFVYVSSENDKTNSSTALGFPRPSMPDALVKLQGTQEQYLLQQWVRRNVLIKIVLKIAAQIVLILFH